MKSEEWWRQLPLSAVRHIVASSITCATDAAALLAPLRGGDPRVEAWFQQKATRAALRAFDTLDDARREVLRHGGPAAEPAPVAERPVKARTLAEFAIEEGFTLVAVVGLRVESAMPGVDPGTNGAVIKLDVASLASEDAPPIKLELVHNLRQLADHLEKNAREAGEVTVRRVMIPKPAGTGGN